MESRYYDPETGRFLNADSLSYLGEGSDLQNYNLYSYCENNPVMYCDPTGHAALAVALGVIAAVGLGLTIVGAATENNGLTAAGLTMVAASALISGGLAAFGTAGMLSTVVGGATMIAGAGTGLFASAEYQQAFTGNNWILDCGISEGWYNGLMIGTASLAMAGTVLSGLVYSFNVTFGKFSKYGEPGYYGIKFKTGKGKIRVLSFHTHGHSNASAHSLIKRITEWHWQLQKWNPVSNEVAGTINSWIWWSFKKL